VDKSPEAFRTISEVADTLETPAHVLRFWESRFPQIRPVKRAGGRRYYRPADVALLTGIKRLLHEEGLTIRGVQKILREQGVRHVAGLAGMPEADLAPFDPEVALEEAMVERFGAERFGAERAVPVPVAEVESAQIFALETALRKPAPVERSVTPDLFDLLAEAEPAAPVPVPVAPEEVAPEPVVVPAAEPEPQEAAQDQAAWRDVELTVSRAALLRALPLPLPDDLRAVLVPLRDRMAAHRDRLTEAARTAGHRG